jgi:Sec-independent protein secretion pathway component TatC
MQPEYIAPDKTKKNQRLFKAIIMAAIVLITFGAGLGVGAIVFNADNKVTID